MRWKGPMLRKSGAGFIATAYGYKCGVANFLRAAAGYRIQTPQPASKVGAYILLQDDDFIRAAGATLAAVNADPRNHFGKHALRRFNK